MRKIGSTWKELYAGYLHIKKAQSMLELRWKRALQVAEKRMYQQQLKEWEREVVSERKQYTKILLICTIFIFCAIPFLFIAWGPALFFVTLAIGLIIVQGVVLHNFKKKIPVKGTEGKKLVGVVELWWRQLKPPPIKIQKYGDEGEKNLLDALVRKLSNNFLALHGYMAKKNLDADIIVFGPTGFWLLESKFNSGTISCNNGEWWQEKKHNKEKNKIRPYDLQWLDEKKEIVETISRRVPQDMLWVLDTIKGGIVFTLNAVHLDIDQSCKVDYGGISYWTKKISTSPTISNLTLGIQLQITDAISDFASQVTENNDRKSAKQLAINICNNAEQEIISFIKANV